MIEQHEVAAYLLGRRLIARRSVVAGTLEIADASSRNRNVRVSGGPGESYLLKQAITDDGAETLANEAALYRRLAAGPPRLAACVPRLHGYDAAAGVLVLEWVRGGADILRHYAGRRRSSPALAAALGRALAALHGVAPDDEPLRRDAPWVLSLHRPHLQALRWLAAPSIELIASVQRDALCARALDELRDGWRVESLVHRDAKAANCIAHPAPGASRATRVKLVDWEMAGWGDPALDVGSALGDLLGLRLGSPRARAGQAEPAIWPERGRADAGAALWRAYAGARGLDGGAVAALARRAVGFAAARLLQSAYEHTQETARASAGVAATLSLARDLLTDPRAAARAIAPSAA